MLLFQTQESIAEGSRNGCVACSDGILHKYEPQVSMDQNNVAAPSRTLAKGPK